MLFACSLRTITANYPTFKQAKSMKTFNILLLNIGSHFKIFSLAAKALAGAWGGLYSIECPRIGGKKTISLKRFFSPTRAPAGPHKNVLYALTFMRGPSETNNNVPRHPPTNIPPSPSSGYGLTPKHRLQHYRTFSTLTLSTAISP